AVIREIIKSIRWHSETPRNKTERGPEAASRPSVRRNGLSGTDYFSAGILLPSVAQPPLPLQEFLPLQPLSLDLQPPLPLQEFWPLQACFSFVALSAFFSVSWAEVEAFPPGNRLEASMLAPVAASKPATAAPVSKKRFDFVIFPNDLLVNFTALH